MLFRSRVLEKVKFEKLEKLYLSENKIVDINILENVNFKELNELDLSGNTISDIKVLEKVKFEKLEKLDLNKQKTAYAMSLCDWSSDVCSSDLFRLFIILDMKNFYFSF